MLTRLKVNGFKNLVNVDVRFGPFTCIAGANGSGKSNLFDAIQFLSHLADHSLLEAATLVRDEGGKNFDVRNLFYRAGDTVADEMSFEAEMLIPPTGVDELGQPYAASITFLRYKVVLAYKSGENLRSAGALQLVEEELAHINIDEAKQHLFFPHSQAWRKSVVHGERRSPYFISTVIEDPVRLIKRHQDGGYRAQPVAFITANLPRTVLSSSNAAASPTALLAKREMQSWQLLQLEPAALRKPDELEALMLAPKLAANGAHLPALLYRLAAMPPEATAVPDVYGQVAVRLAELLPDVREVWIDKDEQRGLLTLKIKNHNLVTFPARALSDGTLRFLALAVLEQDPMTRGVICLEEPENGLHPGRISAMLRLLQDIAVDPQWPDAEDNPLRQVIINTHSDVVVKLVSKDSLLCTETVHSRDGRYVQFSCLPDTWRTQDKNTPLTALGDVLAYIAPLPIDEREAATPTTRVMDLPALQEWLAPAPPEG